MIVHKYSDYLLGIVFGLGRLVISVRKALHCKD